MNCGFCGNETHEGTCKPATPTAKYPGETNDQARAAAIADRAARR